MFYSFMVSTVRLLGRYQGRNGQIEIIECSWDGTRVYFEGGVRQSQATLDGESVFTYVKIMDELLSRPEHILVLGCGGGNLATRLWRLGKKLTIVDINPLKRPPEGLLCAMNGTRAAQQDTRENHSYSITSSARPSSIAGISRPSAFAVLRLILSSNLVGW